MPTASSQPGGQASGQASRRPSEHRTWFNTYYTNARVILQHVPDADVKRWYQTSAGVEQEITAEHAKVVGQPVADRAATMRAVVKSMVVLETDVDTGPQNVCTRGPGGGPVANCKGEHALPIADLDKELMRVFKSDGHSLSFQNCFSFCFFCFFFFSFFSGSIHLGLCTASDGEVCAFPVQQWRRLQCAGAGHTPLHAGNSLPFASCLAVPGDGRIL